MKLSEDCLNDLRDLMIASTEHPNVKGDVFNLVDVIGEELKFYEFGYGDFDGGCFQNGKDNLVCLTFEEIFTLKQMVKWVLKSSSLSGTNKVFLEKTYKILNKRFKQTVNGHEVEQKV